MLNDLLLLLFQVMKLMAISLLTNLQLKVKSQSSLLKVMSHLSRLKMKIHLSQLKVCMPTQTWIAHTASAKMEMLMAWVSDLTKDVLNCLLLTSNRKNFIHWQRELRKAYYQRHPATIPPIQRKGQKRGRQLKVCNSKSQMYFLTIMHRLTFLRSICLDQ